MNTKQSKKMLPLNVLDILNKYSDENHRLSQKDILDILRTKYNMVVDRKAVRNSITDLLDMHVSIQYTEKYRMVLNKKTGEVEEQSVLTDLYMEHDFTNCEICLLIDEILHSGFIPTTQRKALISKLESLSSVYFKKGSYANLSENEPVSNQLFYNLEIVKEAIELGKNVRFHYKKYVTDRAGNLATKQIEYVVTPFETGMVGDNYYLFCSEDGNSEIRLRMDYIIGISVDETDSYVARIDHFNNRKYIVFASEESMISEFVEVFGKNNIRIENRVIGLKICVYADETVATDFALKNSGKATAIEPEGFSTRVYDILKEGWRKYGKSVS